MATEYAEGDPVPSACPISSRVGGARGGKRSGKQVSPRPLTWGFEKSG